MTRGHNNLNLTILFINIKWPVEAAMCTFTRVQRRIFQHKYTEWKGNKDMIVNNDYLCYMEPKYPSNIFLILIFNELFV